MNDTLLGGLMRHLPRTSASPAFSSEVLRRIAEPQARVVPVWRLAAGVAMATCLAIVAQLAIGQYAQQRRVAELRAEQQRLAAELADVKRLAREGDPVIVLENDRGTRVIVDVDSAIQAASLRTFD